MSDTYTLVVLSHAPYAGSAARASLDLALAFAFPMYNRTMIPYLEKSTGVLNTARMGESTCAIQHRSPLIPMPTKALLWSAGYEARIVVNAGVARKRGS